MYVKIYPNNLHNYVMGTLNHPKVKISPYTSFKNDDGIIISCILYVYNYMYTNKCTRGAATTCGMRGR